MSRGGVVDRANAGYITEAEGEELTMPKTETPIADNAMRQIACFKDHPAVECLSDLVLRLERERGELISALRKLSAMYASTWDRVDGSLVMMGEGVKRFEAAHEQARALLTKLKETT